MVPIIDVAILLFLAGFVYYGLFSGLIKMLGYLAGMILGAWAASHFYLTFYNWTDWLYFGHENLGKVISFVLVLGISARLVGFIFFVIEKIFKLLTIIPFLKTINKIAGAIFGLLQGTFFLGLILYVASRYSFIDTFIGSQMANSKLAPFLVKLVNIMSPLFPEALKVLKSVIAPEI